MSKCNPLYTTAYVLLLERLRKDGHFENFSEKDYDNLIEKSISYIENFKDNLERFEALKEKNPTNRGINLVSKHHFTFMDFTENIGVRPLDIIGSDATIQTKYDVIANADDVFFPVTDQDKGSLPIEMSLERLGIKLNYNSEEELFYLVGDMETAATSLKSDLQDLFALSVDGKANPLGENINDVFIPAIKSFLIDLANFNFVASDTLKRAFMGYNLEKLQYDITTLNRSEPIALEKFTAIRNSPISVNGDELKGAFMTKATLAAMVENRIASLIYTYASQTFNSVSGVDRDAPLPEKMHAEFNALVVPALKDLVENLVSYIQKKRDNDIINAFNELQKGNVLHTTNYLARKIGRDNNDIIERYSKDKDGTSFSIDAIAVKPQLSTIPMYNKKEVQYSQVDFAKEELSNSLDRIKLTPVTPHHVKYNVNLKKKTSSIEVVDFMEGKDIPLATIRNNAMNHYLIDKKFAQSGFFSILVLDESDKRADGKFAMVFRAVAEKAISITAASGTPTAGTAKDIVPQLALSGKMDSVSVENNKVEFTRQNGVFGIKSKLIAHISVGTSHNEFSQDFSALYGSYVDAMTDKEGGSTNIYKIVIDGIEKTIIPSLLANGLVESGTFDNVEFNKEVPALKALFSSMMKTNNDTNGVLALKTLVDTALANSHSLTKLLPGINNPKTFVGLIESTGNQNTSIMARETLSGKSEVLLIDDLRAQKTNFPKREKEGSAFTEEAFYKNNRAGVRLAQAAIQEYASDNFLFGVEDFLTQNFKYFMANFVDSRGGKGDAMRYLLGYINDKHDNIFTTGSLFTLFQKSSSSGTDSFENMYKDYLLLNGNLEEKKMYRNMDSTKKEVFADILKVFDGFIKNGMIELSNKGYCEIPLDDDKIIPLWSSKFYLIDSLKSLRSELAIPELLKSIENGYPQSFIFSAKIETCPPEYEYLFKEKNKDGFYMPYRLNFTVTQENEVLDSIASSGIEREIDRVMTGDKTAVVSSARTVGTMLNFLTLLDSAVRYRKENQNAREIAIVFNVPSSSENEGLSYRDVSNNLKHEIMDEHRIVIHPIPRSVLDSTVKSNLEKGFQTMTITNYESASRGLDLSGLDEIIATGAMKKGKDMIQFLSRLYSVNRQSATISMFHGGNDAQFQVGDKDQKGKLVDFIFPKSSSYKTPQEHEKLIESTLKKLFSVPSRGSEGITASMELANSCPAEMSFAETQTGKISILAIDKLMVFKAFMLGTKTSIDSVVGLDDVEKPNVFTASNGYAERIQATAKDIENGLYDKVAMSNKKENQIDNGKIKRQMQ